MSDEPAGQEPEQGAAPETAEQPAGAVNPEQEPREPGQNEKEKYISAGEFGRRMKKIDERMEQMFAAITTQQQSFRPQPPSYTSPQPTNQKEELWARAQGGDRDAFEQYQRIIAREEYLKEQAQLGQKNYVEVQLAELSKLYPALNDSSHPLTQKAQLAYQLFVNSGKPADRATLLEAAKTAIADSPQLIAEMYSQGSAARERARANGVRTAQSGVTGVTYRQDPPRKEQVKELTQAELDLARRMGVKDPKGAKERFLKRQQNGQSSISHTLLPAVERTLEEW